MFCCLTRLTLTGINPGLIVNLKKQDGAANLLANPRIRVAYDRSFAPFSLEDERTMRGLGPDLLREVARRLGLEIVEERPGTWAETYAAALEGRADVLVAAGRNEERRDKLLFIGPWSRSPTALVTRRGRQHRQIINEAGASPCPRYGFARTKCSAGCSGCPPPRSAPLYSPDVCTISTGS